MYSYYPTLQSPFQQPLLPIQQDMEDIKYVSGKSGAEAFNMLPNKKAILMDANLPRFYMKQTDANGQATIRTYDFKEAEAEKPTEYVTKAEFESFKADIKGVKHESTDDVRE